MQREGQGLVAAHLLAIIKTMFLFLFTLAFANSTVLKDKLQIPEGIFVTLKGPTESCPKEVYEFEYEYGDDNTAVHLGEKIIFPRLNHAEYKDTTETSCKTVWKQSLDKWKIEQSSQRDCDNPSFSMTMRQKLVFDGKLLTFTFFKEIKQYSKKIEYTCTYQLMKNE